MYEDVGVCVNVGVCEVVDVAVYGRGCMWTWVYVDLGVCGPGCM